MVVDGIMYVTAPNECYALDAGSGRQIWQYQAAADRRASSSGGANRGVGGRRRARLHGDRQRPPHRAQPLHRRAAVGHRDGGLAQELRGLLGAADRPATWSSRGVSGGEHGANGFVAAHDQETGKEVWRFWTVPKPGQPGSETWQGQGHRARRRADLVHRQLRSRARPRLLAGRQPEPRSTTATTARATTSTASSILALDRKTGTLKVVLPVHAARSVGLGRDADLGPHRRRLAGAAAGR